MKCNRQDTKKQNNKTMTIIQIYKFIFEAHMLWGKFTQDNGNVPTWEH